jgi:hypothetical protein
MSPVPLEPINSLIYRSSYDTLHCHSRARLVFVNPEEFQHKVKVRCNSHREAAYVFCDDARKTLARALPKVPTCMTYYMNPPSTWLAKFLGSPQPISLTILSRSKHDVIAGRIVRVKHPSMITHICSTFLLVDLTLLSVTWVSLVDTGPDHRPVGVHHQLTPRTGHLTFVCSTSCVHVYVRGG